MIRFFLTLTFLGSLSLSAAPKTTWSLVDLANAPSHDNQGITLFAEDFGKKSSWRTFKRVHGKHKDTAKILALCHFHPSDKALRVVISPETRKYKSRTGTPQMVTAGVSRNFKLPPDAAGKLFKVEISGMTKGGCENFLFFFKKGKRLKYYRGRAGLVPAGADQAHFIHRLNGSGEMVLTKVKVTLEEKAFAEDIIAYAHGYMDQKYYLPEKGIVPIFFMAKRPDKKYPKKVVIKLTLPAGVKAIAPEKHSRQIDECTFDIAGVWNTVFPGGFCCWRPIQLMLSSDRVLKGEEMSYQLIFNGSPRPVRKLKLYTMPVVKAPAPREFLSGIMMQASGNMNTAAAESYKKLFLQTGFNALRMGWSSPELRKSFGKTVSFHDSNWGIRDGYPRADKKNNIQPFLTIEGKTFRGQVCPQAVYTHKVPGIKGAFQKIHQQNRFFMNNWEAYSSDYKGCFCKFCKEEFIKYSKLPRKQVDAVWPGKVIARYHDTWVKFRSWQHGLICKTLAEYSVSFGGEFMPMLTVASFRKGGNFCRQYAPEDYLKYLNWINVWGPYLHTSGYNRPYTYHPGNYLKHYYGVKNVVEQIRSKGGKNVKITGLPYGSHGVNLNPPEAVAMETINNFILGYKGSLVYWFHFDYRYWSLMARANAKIASCESMVNKWPEWKKYSVKTVTPYIEPRHWRARNTEYSTFPELEKAPSALITHVWKNKNRFLVAAGNFWERSGVFFKLAIPGLKGEFVVRTPCAPYKYCRVSGKELSKGVLLEAGPLVWEFFLIEPWQKGKNYGTFFDTARRMALQKKTIAQRFKEENTFLSEYEKMFKAADFSFDETPEFTAGTIVLSEKKEKGVQNLLIRTPVYKAILVPSNGGNIKSLVVNGKEAVLQAKSGNFGKIGFWRPKGILVEQSLRIDSIKALKDHVEVTLSRPATANFDLKVVWKFYKDRLYESFTARNVGKYKTLTITRFHHRPMHLANHNKNFFIIGKEKFAIVPKDRFFVQKAGVLGKTVNIKGGDTLFSAPQMKSTLLHKGIDPIQGYYIWNNPGAVTGSFEPIFEGKSLAPGESITIRQEWQIRK